MCQVGVCVLLLCLGLVLADLPTRDLTQREIEKENVEDPKLFDFLKEIIKPSIMTLEKIISIPTRDLTQQHKALKDIKDIDNIIKDMKSFKMKPQEAVKAIVDKVIKDLKPKTKRQQPMTLEAKLDWDAILKEAIAPAKRIINIPERDLTQREIPINDLSVNLDDFINTLEEKINGQWFVVFI